MNLHKSRFREFCSIESILSEDSKIKVLMIPRPDAVAKKAIPSDLNAISLGALLMLQQAKEPNELYEVVAREIVGVDIDALYNAKAYDVIGLLNWLAAQLERINKLFSGAGRKPTAQEERAGYHSLNLGAFGMIDWFAQRMKITHEEAAETPWITVYKSMEADGKLEEYRRRLSDILNEEAKLNAKKR